MQTDMKLDIVIWAFPSWNGDYLKSTVELAKELALRHRVLYIDYCYTLKDMLKRGKEGSIPSAYIMGKENGLQEVELPNGANIHVLSLPPIVPFNWIDSSLLFSIVERLNSIAISRRVRKAIELLGFETDVVVNAFNPFLGLTMRRIFKGCPSIYYCYDNIGASHWASKHGETLEKKLVRKVNAVIYSSDALRKNKHYMVHQYVVNNGVDLRNFQNYDGQSKVSDKTRITIGYVGSVDDRLDYDILETVIKNKPQYDFVFIGRKMSGDWQRLESYSNVTFTGAVDPALLPEMMSKFDVGVIPFIKNDFTKNIYPMKVNEYLALGMPVVSTDFASLPDLEPFMSVAYDALSFEVLLDSEIVNDSRQKRTARKAKAASNSWEQKAKEFEKILLHYASFSQN